MNLVQHLHRLFLRWLGPTILSGVTVRTWWRVLRANRYAVDAPYLGRAALITALACSNSVTKRVEDWRFGGHIEAAEIHPPLFILGCWRSGTTHLHNLLSKDDRLAFPNSYQVMNPHVFLLNESWNAPIHNWFYPSKRAMDDVHFAADQPQEDEFALAGMCGMSPMIAFSFWRRRQHYNRFTTLQEVSGEELKLWKKSLLRFVKKLSVKNQQPLVLKSPAHTARIAILLEMFPDARFVTMHRHPYEVLVSARHMYIKNLPMIALQRYDLGTLSYELVEHYGQLFEAYFDQRDLIPPGRLIEIGYDELDGQPVQVLRHIYRQLALPEFDVAERTISGYIESLAEYRKNTHEELEPDLQRLVAEKWPRCFSAWDYEI